MIRQYCHVQTSLYETLEESQTLHVYPYEYILSHFHPFLTAFVYLASRQDRAFFLEVG